MGARSSRFPRPDLHGFVFQKNRGAPEGRAGVSATKNLFLISAPDPGMRAEVGLWALLMILLVNTPILCPAEVQPPSRCCSVLPPELRTSPRGWGNRYTAWHISRDSKNHGAFGSIRGALTAPGLVGLRGGGGKRRRNQGSGWIGLEEDAKEYYGNTHRMLAERKARWKQKVGAWSDFSPPRTFPHGLGPLYQGVWCAVPSLLREASGEQHCRLTPPVHP